MFLLVLILITLIGVIVGKKIFGIWVNHLSLYYFLHGGMLFLYELKWLPYYDLSFTTYFLIFGAAIAYSVGIFTVVGMKWYKKWDESESTMLNIPIIFSKNGQYLKYSIIIFSLIGLFVAVHRWIVLIGIFGDVKSVLLNGALVYRLNVRGEIKEFIPILPSFVYIAIFLSGIYTAYQGRFTFLSIFPLICIVLKELTYFGRGEMLFSSMVFFFSFSITRYYLRKLNKEKFRFSRVNAVLSIVFIVLLIVSAATFVKLMRVGAKEKYRGVSEELKSLQGSLVFTPSVYFYLSSHVGVLNKYLDIEKEADQTDIGANTFRTVYYLFSKFQIVKEPNFFQRGYHVPIWSNTGTYIRELHADFGLIGVFVVPFLLGLFITSLWYKVTSQFNVVTLLFLVYFYVVIGFSFLMIVTRLNQWWFSQLFALLYLFLLETYIKRK